MKNKLRKVEILDPQTNEWGKVESFSSIKKGDTFRMFEDDGMLVEDRIGDTEFIAENDAYIDEETDIWTVKVIEKESKDIV